MDFILYWFAKTVVTFLQALPLRVVARISRTGGAIAFWLDARHRRVAIRNLTMCFPEKSAAEVRAIAKENFRRLGENYICSIKTAGMTPEELKPHFSFVGTEKILPRELNAAGPQSRVVALGHFGNFELYARFSQFVPNFQGVLGWVGVGAAQRPEMSNR